MAALFNGPGIAGRMARRVLPIAVLLTILIGWLRLEGERLGFYGTGFGLAVSACSDIAMFCVLVGWAAHSLQASSEKLDAAARNLYLSDQRANQTNARLAAIVESSNDAVVSKSLDGTITSWNAAAERIFGYSAAEAIGQPMTMLIPPDRLSGEAQILAHIAAGEMVEPFESVRRRREGSDILVSLTISPLRDASGVVIGASKIARDITASSAPSSSRRPASPRSSTPQWTPSSPSMTSTASPCSIPPRRPCLAAGLLKPLAPPWRAALEDFRSRPDHFAAMVTDLSMPRMSGFDLARQVLSVRTGFPILMTSGYVRPEDQRAAEDLGIRRIITKPSPLD